MNERSLILNAWQQVRPSLSHSPHQQRADEFFARLDSQSEPSWEEMGRVVREKYSDVAPEILSTLLATDHPLIVLNSLRFAKLEDPSEAEALKKFVRQADPQKHQVSFIALAGSREMKAELKAKKNLPESVRAALKK